VTPFLDDLVRDVRRSVEDPGYDAGVPSHRPRTPPSLRRSIERERASGALLVEYKRVSPGQANPVLPPRSIVEFLEATHQAPVTAYSCLATSPRWDGCPRDVADLARGTDLPVLFKDVVVDRRQVEVAARTGASAVLLIARLADQAGVGEPLSSLAEAAHHRGLEVVLEFHHRSELSHGAGVEADVFGVNSRDLESLRLERATAEATLREAHALGLRPLLGLSGVESANDARRFWESGADGILIGSAVARTPLPAEFLSGLRRRPVGGSR
jgi:indole-3-glycerol phosphate synthase